MVTDTLDRRTPSVGGRFVALGDGVGATAAVGTGTEAFLALADGRTWRVHRVVDAPAAAGRVDLIGETVVVGLDGMATLASADAEDLARHLATATGAGQAGRRGCVSAPGATLPIHRVVALAVARGEIGRP